MLSSSLAERALALLPRPWRERIPALYRLALLIFGVAVAVGSSSAVWAFTIDDAGISYAYAKHLADGDGPVAAVGGPWIEGYSNPLWVLSLIPFEWLGLSIPGAAKLLGAGLFGVALVLGVATLTGERGRGFRQWGAVEMAFVVASAACLELTVWASSGLENGLFAALVVLLCWLDARESEQPSRFAWSGLVAFLLSITRPEGVLYAAPIVALKLASALLRHEPLRQAQTAALLFAGPLVGYHAVHYLVFGQLVPNTYYAKPGSRDWAEGLAYLLASARTSGLLYAAPLVLVGLFGRVRLKVPLAWVCVAGMAFVIYAGGDWMPHARFLSLFAPAWLLLAALGLGRVSALLARVSRGRIEREPWALLASAPLVFFWYGYQQPRLAKLSHEGWCHFCERSADTARIMQFGQRAGLPTQSLVTQDYGGPSWLSDERFYPLDFLGLCDRSVALIRGQRMRGGIGEDYRFYQYLIHEQPTAPSWVLVPPNFWPRFDRSPEFAWDYFELSPRLLPKARRDSFFVLHRGELIDYFPPLGSLEFRQVDDRLRLLGLEVFADPTAPQPNERWEPGARVLVVVSLVASARLRGTEQVAVRVDSGAARAESKLLSLDRGLEGIAQQVAPGEPLSVEVPLVLPERGAENFSVSLGLGHAQGRSQRNPKAGHAPVFREQRTFEAGAPLPPLERGLPRYPSALPPALDAELFRLQPDVIQSVQRSRARGEPLAAEALSRQLAEIGARLEAEGQPAQAYLANVWATQVNRRAWESLADVVFRLRPAARGVPHATEVALLRRYYSAGSPGELARLIAFYVAEGRAREADYFWRRWPASAPETEQRGALRAVLSAAVAADGALRPLAAGALVPAVGLDPLGGALDFEASELAGWTGASDVFRAGPDPARRDLFAFRGEHGRRVLSSREAGERAQGEILSPEFALDGRVVSLLVAGGSAERRVGVQLLVDDRVAFAASGNDSDALLPVFWNVEKLAGKRARLRLFDQSPRDHVAIDHVVLWR